MSSISGAGQPNPQWLVVRHLEHEHIGTIQHLLDKRGIIYRYADVYRGDRIPESPQGLRGLIVMGGSMGVYESERYPFLIQEQRLIRSAAAEGLPVIGICLGAQLIAAALGARVYPGGRKEIGWYEVQRTAPEDAWTSVLPPRFTAFHWHGDTFDLPPGATRLFRSDLFPNQSFRHGNNVLAVQFHFEVTAKMIDEWLDDPGCRAELDSAGLSPEPIRKAIPQWAGPLEAMSARFFSRFLSDFVPDLPARAVPGSAISR